MNKEQGEQYLKMLSKTTDFFRSERITSGVGVPVEWTDPDKSYFCCPSGSDAMSGIGINKGDLLVFEVIDTLNSGEAGLFFCKGDRCVCRIYREYDSGRKYLMTAGNSEEPYRIEPDDTDFHIVGRLAAILKNMKDKTF